ncbi:MAG: CobD/CbiB family cobalamin biosynthesis protein, partial [Acidimicrobiales bacterium]
MAAALILDRLLGEPPPALHPVAAFGRSLGALERGAYRDSKAAGVGFWIAGVSSATLAGRALAGGRDGHRGAAAAMLATTTAVAGRALARAAASVDESLARGDLSEARHRLPALVGRDPAGLGEAEMVRAVVESVAENTVDAVVAPAMWGVAAGAAGTLGYRAVNTLDAMVGHRGQRYERFGWASARADDVANWLPARLTAALVTLVRPAAVRGIWRAVLDDAPAHPSPNAG